MLKKVVIVQYYSFFYEHENVGKKTFFVQNDLLTEY